MSIPDKLKQARKLLMLGQVEAASGAGMGQKDISQLEHGNKKFIPTDYIQFLLKNGIDLNTLFDDNEETVSFIKESKQSQPKISVGLTVLIAMVEDINERLNKAGI